MNRSRIHLHSSTSTAPTSAPSARCCFQHVSSSWVCIGGFEGTTEGTVIRLCCESAGGQKKGIKRPCPAPGAAQETFPVPRQPHAVDCSGSDEEIRGNGPPPCRDGPRTRTSNVATLSLGRGWLNAVREAITQWQ